MIKKQNTLAIKKTTNRNCDLSLDSVFTLVSNGFNCDETLVASVVSEFARRVTKSLVVVCLVARVMGTIDTGVVVVVAGPSYFVVGFVNGNINTSLVSGFSV